MPLAGGSRRVRVAIVSLVALVAYSTTSRSQLSPSEREQTKGAILRAEQLIKNEGRSEQGIKVLEETLDRIKRSAGPVDESVGVVSTYLGVAYCEAGRFEEAEPVLREAVKIGRALPGTAGDFRHSASTTLAATLMKRSKFDEAVPIYEDSLKDIEARHGVDDWRTNLARSSLTNAYLFAKRYRDAIPIGRACLKYAEAKFEVDGPETIRFRYNLAVALMESGEYLEAKALFGRSMDIVNKRLKPEHEDSALTLAGLTKVNQLIGRSADTLDLALKLLAAVEARPDPKPADLIAALSGVAMAYQTAGRHDQAERAYLRALTLAREVLDPAGPTTATLLNNLSTMLVVEGRFVDAERYVREALEITAKDPGRGTVTYATQLSNLASIYAQSGRPEKALPLVEEALKILEDRLEKGHPEISAVRHNLATLSWAARDYKKSVEQGEIALADLRERFGGDNLSTVAVLINLGQSYVGLGEFGKAEDRLKRAMAFLDSVSGSAPRELNVIRHALAELYIETEKYDRAEALCRANVDDSTASLGLAHPDTAVAIDDLVLVYYLQGRRAEAFGTLDGSRKSRRDFLLRTLPGLSGEDQFALIDRGERLSRDFALLLAVQRRGEPGVASRSAEWVVNGKAITTRALAIAAVLARDSTNSEAIRILGELNAARGRLARLALARDKDGDRPVAAGADYKALVKQELDLSGRLSLALGSPVIDDWTNLPEVRASLPADAVFVEFAKVFVTESKLVVADSSRPKLARYAAWVIPPAGLGEVTLVDLGFADTLEKAVSDVLLAMKPPPGEGLGPGEEEAAERSSLVALRVLSDRLYKPLATHLAPAKRWVLGLDAALWFVPWAALPVGEDRYAVERHLIHLNVSGRDLVARPATAASGKPAILADPDYDLGVGKAVAKARELGRARNGAPEPARGRGRLRSESLSAAFDRLPATRDEAKAIAPLMKVFAGAEPEVFLGEAASETVFKALRSPKVLVLSTHGFFLEDPEPDPSGRRPDPGSRSIPANPLLRSGLILAGYNRALSVGDGDNDDGLITGLEVAGCDLRGTDLVVLSACETGLGQVRAGEGVAGLRQVFQLAGAKAVVASLWKVPDFESYQLMSAFFQGLSRGRGNAEALREAQLALIAEQRARRGAAHPYFWAAFTLTGFPGPSWRDEVLVGLGSSDLPPLPRSVPEGVAAAPAVSPVTGLPESGSPWSDAGLAIALLIGGGWAGRRWWRLGGSAAA